MIGMTRRTQEQWLVLFNEQKSGGLNNTEFCKTKKTESPVAYYHS